MTNGKENLRFGLRVKFLVIDVWPFSKVEKSIEKEKEERGKLKFVMLFICNAIFFVVETTTGDDFALRQSQVLSA